MRVRWLLPGLIGVFLSSSPALAGRIENWNFDANRRQLDLTTDEGVQPKVFLIANPTRLVVDLPGIILQNSQTAQRQEPFIQNIRLGQFDNQTTRLVIELASGYTIDPKKVRVRGESPTRWVVQLPSLERGTFELSGRDGQTLDIPLEPLPPYQLAGVISLRKEMPRLQERVQSLMARYNFLQPGMFFLNLDSGDYLDISGDRVFPAASTIKLPILIAFFQDLDAGKVSLKETLVMRRGLMTNGSGTMQYKPAGTRFSALETITKMITISDNTATNMIIDRLGGIAKLNERFQNWGLEDTVIRNWLSDLRGTNTTSAKDMVRLLALLSREKLLSKASRVQALEILRNTKTKSLLPAGLGSGALISHKTGDIGFLIGDAGLITMPNGQQYLAGIYVRRPYDDLRGRDFIRQVSRLVYDYLNSPTIGASVNLIRN